MIITRSHSPTQVLLALLKDSEGQGIRAFGDSRLIIAYLEQYPDRVFLLEPSLNGHALAIGVECPAEPALGDIFTGRVRFDSLQDKLVCG